MGTVTEACSTCRFYRAPLSCRRYPATVARYEDDWCGEYQRVAPSAGEVQRRVSALGEPARGEVEAIPPVIERVNEVRAKAPARGPKPSAGA